MNITGSLTNISLQEPVNLLRHLWTSKVFPVGASNKKKAALLTLGASIALICRMVYAIYHVPKSLQHFPSVSYLKILFSILKREDPTTRVLKVFGPAIEKGNGIFVANFPVGWTVFVCEPKAAKLLLMKTDNFPKHLSLFKALGPKSPFVRFLGSENVVTANGDAWKRQRKILNPTFHKSMPVQLFGTLMLKGFKNIERQNNEVVAMDFFQRLTLDALGIAGFGFDFKSLDDPDSIWTTTYENIRQGFRNPLLFTFPRLDFLIKHFTPGRRQLDESVDKLNNLLLEMAQERRRLVQSAMHDTSIPEHEKDLLTLMLEAELRGEGSASDDELRANLAVFFLAGHETTTTAMSFCMYSLAIDKQVQSKARQEVLEVLGDEPVDVLPQLEDVRRFPYLDMILKENLRRFGPVGMLITRKAEEDFDLNGVLIPKGTSITVETHALHHNPTVWKNPAKFDPERFAPGGEHEMNHEGMAWGPFAGGSRSCLGQMFSMHEQRVFLSMLLRKYEWELPADSIHRNGVKIGTFNTTPPNDLKIKFYPRY